MARPVVLVYQEYASVTVTPTTPDLNCLLVGPAYWIKDYLDDKGDLLVSSGYGTKNANNPYTPPVAFTDAITVAEPPSNKTGALLDSESVTVYFDECRVLIAQDADTGDVSTGASVDANKNLVTATGATPIDFLATGVKAGDYLIIADPAGGGTNLVKRVLAVDSATVLRTTTNFTTTNTTLLFRLEREVSDVVVDDSFVVISGNEIKIEGGVTTILTGETTPRPVNYAKVYIEYRSLRQDLRDVDTVSSETDITTKIGKIDARNPLAGMCFVSLQNTTTEVQFFGVKADALTGHTECMEVIEGRKDIYAIVPVTVDKNIIAAYKTQVEGLADVVYAETNGIPQKFRVVIGAQALPTAKTVSGPYTAGAHHCIDGAVAGTPIVSADAINVFVDILATFVTAGVRAGDVLTIISDTAGTSRVGNYTVAEVYDEKRLRVTTPFPAPVAPNEQGKLQGNVQYYIMRGTGTPVASTSFTGGTTTALTNKVASVGVTGVAGHVGKVVRITASSVPADIKDWLITALALAGPPAEWTIAPTGVISDGTGVAGSLVAPVTAVTVARQATTRRPFRKIINATSTFITDGVKATDLLQVPNPISGTDYTTNAPYSSTVAYIPNENDVILDSNTDVIATNLEDGDSTLKFRIQRTLTKNDQVDELVIISQSFNSRRVILVWPDSVMVAGLTDGSKPRAIADTPELADAQPGYYLGAAVGGMTAGLPSHQGFTNLGIAGVDRIYHSTGYFSDTQITEISDGGWFVFGQESPNALPACVHQLTTDTDTLETGEYSLVKNFDFIALFFQDILEDFLGVYNINDETISFLKQAMITGIDLLKLRKYAKIGSPINDASITSLGPSSAAEDRVEAYMTLDMPKPLNRIGLHLISV
jgi:hypothetical protein